MTSATYRTVPLSEPIREMIRTASDEQLATIIDSDQEIYDDDLLVAAQEELKNRREGKSDIDGPDLSSFNIAAFVFGPVWYLYHGLIGRGLMLMGLQTGYSRV